MRRSPVNPGNAGKIRGEVRWNIFRTTLPSVLQKIPLIPSFNVLVSLTLIPVRHYSFIALFRWILDGLRNLIKQ